MALSLVQWEEYLSRNALPSRHRTSLEYTRWGAASTKGMGFGAQERRSIIQDDMAFLPSYNEVMKEHQDRVQHWKESPTDVQTKSAIHTVCECLRASARLKEMSGNYQWDAMRSALREEPFRSLSDSANVLRNFDDSETIGFDWAACAWRHCGALADATEALDEIDNLLGVLEPFEINFCLDIVERSLRDILLVVPWDKATGEDLEYWRKLPAYQAHRVFEPVSQTDEEEEDMTLDDAYMKALQELRIDDD